MLRILEMASRHNILVQSPGPPTDCCYQMSALKMPPKRRKRDVRQLSFGQAVVELLLSRTQFLLQINTLLAN